MRILFFPTYFEGYGTGNVARMYYLYQHFQKHSAFQLSFFSNSPASKAIIDTLGGNINWTDPKTDQFNVVLFDCPSNYNHRFSRRRESIDILTNLRTRANLLVGFDFHQKNNRFFDLIINLRPSEFEHPNAQVLSGLDFAILKDEVLLMRQASNRYESNDILVAFGGEDPNNLTQRALNSLRGLSSGQINVIAGSQFSHTTETRRGIHIIKKSKKVGSLIAASKLVICGAGNTLLEAIYLGVPTVVVPQNDQERIFRNYLRELMPIFALTDVAYLLKQDVQFRQKIRERFFTFLDGEAKVRILNTITQICHKQS